MTTSHSPGRKERSRERILEVASRGIRRKGFEATGVAEVMKQAGLTHGGFYAHFASRDELLSNAAFQAGVESRAIMEAHIDRLISAGVEPFRALVETYLHEDGIEDKENGCPVAALASEMPRQAESVQVESRKLVLHLHRLIVQSFDQDSRPADGEAWAIASALVGALQLARVAGDRESARAILAGTKKMLLERHAPRLQR